MANLISTNKDSWNIAIWNLFNDYETCFMQSYSINNGVDLEEVSKEDIFPMIDEDLSDKGFSTKEIEEILLHQINESTCYKLGAYMIALFNPASNYGEWKNVVNNDAKIELEEEHIKRMWDMYQEIDY